MMKLKYEIEIGDATVRRIMQEEGIGDKEDFATMIEEAIENIFTLNDKVSIRKI